MITAQSVFKRDPFGMVFSIIVTITALGLAVFGPVGLCQSLGTFVAALAGAHISWIISHVGTIDRAREILRGELVTASRHLAEITGRISLTTRQFSAGSIDAEIAVDRIAQHIGGLYGLVNDLQITSGVDFSSEALVSTVTACENMISSLEGRLGTLATSTNAPKQIEEMKADFESMRLQLASTKDLVVPRRDQVHEFIGCPNCDSRVSVRIGTAKGDSSTGWCQSCEQTFHVHRGNEGLFAKPWGGAISAPGYAKPGNVYCPNCNGPIPYSIKPNENQVERYCLNCCKQLVQIDRKGTIVSCEEIVPIRGNYIRMNAYSPYFRCPECNNSTAFLRDDESSAFGVCQKCHKLVIATKAPEQLVLQTSNSAVTATPDNTNQSTNNPMHPSGGSTAS